MAVKKEKKEAVKKEAPKSGSILAGLDLKVSALADEVGQTAKKVGGDLPRGMALAACDKINEAADLLVKAEREDR